MVSNGVVLNRKEISALNWHLILVSPSEPTTHLHTYTSTSCHKISHKKKGGECAVNVKLKLLLVVVVGFLFVSLF